MPPLVSQLSLGFFLFLFLVHLSLFHRVFSSLSLFPFSSAGWFFFSLSFTLEPCFPLFFFDHVDAVFYSSRVFIHSLFLAFSFFFIVSLISFFRLFVAVLSIF